MQIFSKLSVTGRSMITPRWLALVATLTLFSVAAANTATASLRQVIAQTQPKIVKMAITEEMKKHGARKQAKLAVAKKYIEGKRRWAKEVDEEANAMPEGAKVEEVA